MGTVFHQGFQVQPIVSQFLVTRLQGVNHGVQTTSELCDFVATTDPDAVRKMRRFGNPCHQAIEIFDRGGKAARQALRQPKRHTQGEQ